MRFKNSALINVFIIGSGRLAHHLTQAFNEATDISILGVYSRTVQNANAFASKFSIPAYHNLAEIPSHCDAYFLAVTDSSIAAVAEQLKVSGMLVHCSGMMPLEVLKNHERRGVLWPVQTFSNELQSGFKNIPVCIEATDENDYRFIENIALKISDNINRVSQIERQQLHLAAVMVNNFGNHLFTLAEGLLKKNKLAFDLLKPLIMETAAKIERMPPALAQTGPAARKDFITIAKHEALLKEDPDLLKIYQMLTSSIIDTIE